jgi:hypothetical protein
MEARWPTAVRRRQAWSDGEGGRGAGEERALTSGVPKHSAGSLNEFEFDSHGSKDFKLVQTSADTKRTFPILKILK